MYYPLPPPFHNSFMGTILSTNLISLKPRPTTWAQLATRDNLVSRILTLLHSENILFQHLDVVLGECIFWDILGTRQCPQTTISSATTGRIHSQGSSAMVVGGESLVVKDQLKATRSLLTEQKGYPCVRSLFPDPSRWYPQRSGQPGPDKH